MDPESFSIPNLVVVVAALSVLLVVSAVQRLYIGPCFESYRNLSYRDRFDWDRRAINLVFQVIQTLFNGYLLMFDEAATADVLYGYSVVAHYGFLIIIAFYIYDSFGVVMHPLPSSAFVWITHHFISVALLVYDAAYMRCSAFPAATFLISAAGHIPNELRWFLAVSNQRRVSIINVTHVLCMVVVFITCGIPPLVLIIKAARQLEIAVLDVVFKRMRVYCISVSLLIYIPHVILIYIQIVRAFKEWDKIPGPFRHRKVD